MHWEFHHKIIDTAEVKWATRAMWAPSIISKENKYHLFFGTNDNQSDEELGGIGVTVADQPSGPFKDLLGEPLIGEFHKGAQPIDQFAFKDEDGQYYLYYGGWRHCNAAKLIEYFTGFEPFADGSIFKEVTAKNYA